MNSKWLEDYLLDAVGKKVCTKIYCTTCGALEFRTGVLNALSGATGQRLRKHFDRESTLEVARGLAGVEPNSEPPRELEKAVPCILFDLWTGIPLFDNEVEALLAGTWAGEILRKMKAHHEARETERRAHEAFNDPINVKKRTEEKKRLKQEQHQQRLVLKKQRDRLWREKNGKEV